MKIPLILWGKKPPSHSITCIARCYKNSRIMTGSVEGQIGCWDIIYDHSHDNYSIQPFCIIFAHSCSIDDICLLSNIRMGIHSGLVSLSNSGELCLWNPENGCCLNTTFVNAKFNKIYGIYGQYADVRRQSLIVCYGTHPEMQIFDPFSLEMLFTLKQSCAWPNFISTLCFFPASSNLYAVTYSGIVKTWDMSDAFQKNSKSSIIKDSTQYNLALQHDCIVRQILPNLTSNKHFLLVTSKRFFIYDSTKMIRLISTAIQLQQCWAGGNFLGNNMVIMWDKNGTCYLFAISNNECTTVFDSPLLYAVFHTDQTEIGLSVTMLNHSHKNMENFGIFQGSVGGRLTFWRLPLLENLEKHVSLWCDEIHEMSELLEEEGFKNEYQKLLEDHVVHMKATYVTGLDDLFRKTHPPNIINKIDDANNNTVCCSIFLTETGFIAAGRTNGNITLIPALQALCFEFLHSETISSIGGSDAESEYCNLVGHTKKITYLFYPYDDNDHYQPHHLLSGSADFTVRLWNIVSLAQLACFCYHAGVITKILPVPANNSSLLGSSIVTIGSDHTVNVINIDTNKHILQANSNNSPVKLVKWRIEEDLMLLGCGDGVIYIWQLSTGKLDRCVSGSLALEILETFSDGGDQSYSTSITNSSSNSGSLSERNRIVETKISRVASSLAIKLGRNYSMSSKDKMHQLRFHNHHHHSNHHINISSLKKSKIKRRSFKMMRSLSGLNRGVYRSERSLKECEQNYMHSSSSFQYKDNNNMGIAMCDTRNLDITSTTLNMASQPLTNLQPVSNTNLNNSKVELNEEFFGNPSEPPSAENVSHTTNQYLPFNIISARTSYQNDDVHVLLFDPDAIIRTINYLEETLKSIKNLRVRYMKKSSTVSIEEFSTTTRPKSAVNLSVKFQTQCGNRTNSNTGSKHEFNTSASSLTDSQNSFKMSSCFKYLSLAVAPPNNISDYSKYLTKHAYYHSKMIREAIQILISVLSAWGLDKNFDALCQQRLHLNPPIRSVCFGLISYGKLVAQLPVSSVYNSTENVASIDGKTMNNAGASVGVQKSVVRHWNSSKTMLTQHIVTIVSIANAILGAESSFVMDYIFSHSNIDMLRIQHHHSTPSPSKTDPAPTNKSFVTHCLSFTSNGKSSNSSSSDIKTEQGNGCKFDTTTTKEKSRFIKKTITYDSNDLIFYIKSGWSEISNFYCFKINTCQFECKEFHFRGVVLHELIRHWLSFNAHIREASRSILLSELTRLGIDHASDLIKAWSYFLPNNISFYDYIYTSSVTDQIPVSYPAIQNSLVIESGGSYGYWPTPVHHRATLALYIISFVICELFIPQTKKEFNLGALAIILPASKLEAITNLLVESIMLGPNQKVHYPTPTKRASIWLIGRGFKVFSQHIDFSKVVSTLIDIAATSEIIMKYHNSKQPRASKIEYAKAYDTWTTTQDTLYLIATHKPIKFLNVIDSNVIKNVSNGSLLSSISVSSTTALHMYNIYVNNYNNKKPLLSHQPSSDTISYLNDITSNENNNVLNFSSIGAIIKKQIFQILNHIFDVCYNEISPYIIEIFDLTLQCLSPKVLRGKSIDLFQQFKMFTLPIVNYNDTVKKLAVGTKEGKIALYDVRTLKLSIFPAHDTEITFISFSNDGKYLVTFSKIDRKLKTWHSQFSLIGLINNPFKQHNTYLITLPDGNDRLLECTPSFEWNDSRHITLFIDQNQFSFVV